MFVLEVISGPYRGQAIKLVQNEVITIGRSIECTVTFEDSQLSSRHAEFDWTQNGFSVFDLGSSNGTYINGHRIEGRANLVLGDHLQVGSTILQLADVDLETAEVELIDRDAPKRGALLAMGAKTQIGPGKMLLALGDQKTTVQKKTAELKVDDLSIAAAAKLKEVVAAGGHGSKVVVQREGRHDPFWSLPVTIGREHSSGIVLDDASVSLRHALIDHRDGRYLIRDLGSSNGTFRNGRRIVEEALEDGDVLMIGSYAILVVLGTECLGLDLQPPTVNEQRASGRKESRGSLGVIGKPLGDRPEGEAKKKRKKATDLIWYATSDLDRGAFKARGAIVAMLIGGAVTAFMLASGDSEILAGNRLSAPHESQKFAARVDELGRDQCTACHIGAGRISTLRCLDCHPENRPSDGHVAGDVECLGCHLEHRGHEFRSAAAATLDCERCHEHPHEKLSLADAKMVKNFDIDVAANVTFHLHHEEQGVACLKCHDPSKHSKSRGIRGACGQCHAPKDPAAGECQLCHELHPDRTKSSTVVAELPPMQPPPKFAVRSLLWGGAMIVLCFLIALLIPKKKRHAAIEAATESST